MSSKANAKAPTVRVRRLNFKALIALVAAVVLVPSAFLGLMAVRARQGQPALLAEAEKLVKEGKPDLALSYLNTYVDSRNGDSRSRDKALDLRAQILDSTARDAGQVLAAIKAYNQILGRDRGTPKAQEARRKLIFLNLKLGPEYGRTAETLARELIRDGAKDAEAHRLLGHSLELLALMGGEDAQKYLDEALREYERAETMEPGDVSTSERLAVLYRTRFDDRDKAMAVLDKLLGYNKNAPEKMAAARVARARHYLAVGEKDRAQSELQEAIRAIPGDLDARLMLSEMAAQVGDTVAARKHLDSIDKTRRNDLRIQLVGGLIELNEQKLDAAIQSWRAGLLQVGGTDEQLTWRLAQVLLQLNRVAEARPLIEQYRRLIGSREDTPEYRYLRALTNLKSAKPKEAVAELEAIQYRIDKALGAQLYFVLGQAYEATRDVPKALAAYRQAGDRSRRWNGPWLAIARLQLQDQPDEAAAALERGLEAIPDDPNLLASLAQMEWRKQVGISDPSRRNWSKVEAILERGKRIAPSSAELAMVQADHLNATGRADDALALLQAGVRQNPNSVGLWLATTNLLGRRGQIDEALAILDQATLKAGEQAVFRTTKAYLLQGLGRAKQARAVLAEGIDRVAPDQRPTLWKALGEFYLNQGDRADARRAFAAWAKLQPDAPEPRMQLLDLALADGDETSIRAEVEGMRTLAGGSSNLYWHLGRVQELLRNRPDQAQGQAGGKPDPVELKRLDEAEKLIREIELDSGPRLALAPLLKARMLERRHKIDEAIAAYRDALAARAGTMALRPLVDLLTRERRFDDLEALRRSNLLTPDMQKLSAEVSLRVGDQEQAQQMMDRLVQADPGSVDLRTWQSKMFREMGKPDQAEKAIRLLIQQRPEESGPWLQLLMLQVGLKQWQAASDTVEKIRQRVKADRPELLWAICYRQAGKPVEAERYMRLSLQKWPDDPRVRTAAVNFFEAAGKVEESEASLRYMLKRDPTQNWAARKLALLLAARPRDRAAWSEALKLVGESATGADTVDDRLVRAAIYGAGSRPQDRQEAARILQGILTEDPRSTSAAYALARLMDTESQPAKAREYAARAADAEDAGAEPILYYAAKLLSDGRLDEAQKYLTRLESIAPDGLATVELRARLLAARGKSEEAARGLEKAFDDRRSDLEVVAVGQGIMRVLLLLKQIDAAERVGRKLAETGPRGVCTLAEFLAGQKRDDEAQALLGQVGQSGDPLDAGRTALLLALAHDNDARWIAQADQLLSLALKGQPTSVETLQALATVRHAQGQYHEEIGLYNRVESQNPKDFLFLNNMAWTLSEDLKRPEEALKKIEEAANKIGFNPHVADTRGVILTRLGRYPEAIKELELATASMPDPVIFYHLARAYQLAGRKADFEKYRDLARQAGLKPERVQPSERAEMESLLKS